MHNQELIIAVFAVTLVFVILTLFATLFLLIHRKKQNLNRKEKENMKNEFRQELLSTQLEIQEQTFKAISQEIHDNIGQMLSLARMNLSKFEMDRHNSDEAVLSAKELVSKAVASLRDLSKSLNTDTIATIGLMRSIEMELQLVEKTTGVPIQFDVKGHPQKLPPQQELILFRIVQEALHNSIKHANASLLSVHAAFENDVLHLTIKDDGKGFDASVIEARGSGLLNMESRSKMIGAAWSLQSSPANGTIIQLIIPTNLQYDNNSFGRRS